MQDALLYARKDVNTKERYFLTPAAMTRPDNAQEGEISVSKGREELPVTLQ